MPRKRSRRPSLKRQRALAVLARMRSRGESLMKSARLERITPRTVRKIVGKQLKRDASGHYRATRGDTLRREEKVSRGRPRESARPLAKADETKHVV